METSNSRAGVSQSGRLARERRTVAAMIEIYCRAHHGSHGTLCAECSELRDYALARLDHCKFGPDKPACQACPVHCYKPRMRDRIQTMMRFSGPRMLWRHPILAFFHFLDGRRRNHCDGPAAPLAIALTMILCFGPSTTLLRAGPVQPDASIVWPGRRWETASPESQGMSTELLQQAARYAQTGDGSGYVTRHGKLVYAWGDPKKRYDLKSTSKSIGVTVLGLALKDGKVKLSDRARAFHPALGTPPAGNARTGWLDEITLAHLANQTAGFEKPGGYGKLLFKPGTQWHYSDAGPNWLAECLTRLYGRDLNDVLFTRVFTPLGITPADIRWRKNNYRPDLIDGIKRREFGSGFSANVDAMARIGYLYLRHGRWKNSQIIPESFVTLVSRPNPDNIGLPEHDPGHGDASDHYSTLWWNNGDSTIPNVPRDTYWSWGLYDSLIVVMPSLDIVAARAGRSWQRHWQGHYEVLKPFLRPLAASAQPAQRPASPARSRRGGVGRGHAPYPPSKVVTEVRWAAKEQIRRLGCGGDNWPITWGDDDRLYTAYGDGNGFVPHVPHKLSMGFAAIAGPPDTFRATNIRSLTGETTGNGPHGKKASGLLMVNSRLYLWARNAGNSQLAWSEDHGRTWHWASWKFTTSFGCPTFLNFGRNYARARDEFVYVYSPDSDSAYAPADRMVLARVPGDQIRQRAAYEFYRGCGPDGRPRWSHDIADRAAVFEHPGRCYRSGITFDQGLKRYLWCQVLPASKDARGPRFQGGFGIYDAPEPWGPWTTLFFTEQWDVGPGESSCFPAKWISADGKTLHLVFSGDDCFSVRRVDLQCTARK